MELTQRRQELKPLYERLMKDDLFPRNPESFTLWNRLNEGVLRVPLDPPAWFNEDMNNISLLYEYESLPVRIQKTGKRIQEIGKQNAKKR